MVKWLNGWRVGWLKLLTNNQDGIRVWYIVFNSYVFIPMVVNNFYKISSYHVMILFFYGNWKIIS